MSKINERPKVKAKKIEAKTMFVVIIEWDGEKPPRTWYSRMHELVGRVRGDKEDSVVLRREDKGIIFQEGALILPSESLARELAFLARFEYHAAAVSIHETRSLELAMTREDEQIMKRVANVLGKRGRKPPQKRFSVTCLEDMKAWPIEHHQPIQCPKCAGLRIHIREGSPRVFKDDGSDIFELWVRTRFWGPHWEPAKISEAKKRANAPALNTIEIGNDKEAALVGALSAAPVLDLVRQMDRRRALEVLDAMLCGRVYTRGKRRMEHRINAFTAFMQMGGAPLSVSLHEQTEPDLFDVATNLGAREAASMTLEFQNASSADEDEATA